MQDKLRATGDTKVKVIPGQRVVVCLTVCSFVVFHAQNTALSLLLNQKMCCAQSLLLHVSVYYYSDTHGEQLMHAQAGVFNCIHNMYRCEELRNISRNLNEEYEDKLEK